MTLFCDRNVLILPLLNSLDTVQFPCHCCCCNLATTTTSTKLSRNMMVAKQRKQHVLSSSSCQFDKTASPVTVYRQKGLKLAKTLKLNFNINITDKTAIENPYQLDFGGKMKTISSAKACVETCNINNFEDSSNNINKNNKNILSCNNINTYHKNSPCPKTNFTNNIENGNQLQIKMSLDLNIRNRRILHHFKTLNLNLRVTVNDLRKFKESLSTVVVKQKVDYRFRET